MKINIFNHEKLKTERIKHGFSFGVLATKLQEYEPKSSKTLVWKWENKSMQPTIRYLMALCKVFKCKMDFFYKH